MKKKFINLEKYIKQFIDYEIKLKEVKNEL